MRNKITLLLFTLLLIGCVADISDEKEELYKEYILLKDKENELLYKIYETYKIRYEECMNNQYESFEDAK